ncbi:MAG: crossover junction endodeoxyribonuclease RuvC [Desulfobacteraceae bacterium]|nr:crossover junction endodeoxyribonuclease RuvC [Desulfobacteraceae bacterium]
MTDCRKIIGIDPGLASTGVGIINGCSGKITSYGFGCIKTSKEINQQDRLYKIYKDIFNILEQEKPSIVIIEDVFSIPEFPKSGIILGKVCGAISLACSCSGISMLEVQVRLAKQILTGNGNCSKQQLENAVRKRLNHYEKIKPYHASDALALAIIGLSRSS